MAKFVQVARTAVKKVVPKVNRSRIPVLGRCNVRLGNKPAVGPARTGKDGTISRNPPVEHGGHHVPLISGPGDVSWLMRDTISTYIWLGEMGRNLTKKGYAGSLQRAG
ncbi:hypothetical protein Bbelb_265500 [Branchiostoma belcheri]|nr:hypothetical protein Bbelb_265500 [Branchiostoma belcheri]